MGEWVLGTMLCWQNLLTWVSINEKLSCIFFIPTFQVLGENQDSIELF